LLQVIFVELVDVLYHLRAASHNLVLIYTIILGILTVKNPLLYSSLLNDSFIVTNFLLSFLFAFVADVRCFYFFDGDWTDGQFGMAETKSAARNSGNASSRALLLRIPLDGFFVERGSLLKYINGFAILEKNRAQHCAWCFAGLDVIKLTSQMILQIAKVDRRIPRRRRRKRR